MTEPLIGLEDLLKRLDGIRREELSVWIERRWVRPRQEGEVWRFAEIDIARCRLIADMRLGFALDDEAMPVLLSLLDQLYATRRQLRTLTGALSAMPEDVKQLVADALRRAQAE